MAKPVNPFSEVGTSKTLSEPNFPNPNVVEKIPLGSVAPRPKTITLFIHL